MTFAASGGFGLNLKDMFDNTTAMDWPTDAWKAALFTNSLATPDYNTATAYGVAPFNANEVSGTGYTVGGVALANKTLAVAAGVLKLDADDASWAAATIANIRGALVYDATIASPTNQPGLVAVTFGADFSVTSGTFSIVWNAAGVTYLTFA